MDDSYALSLGFAAALGALSAGCSISLPPGAAGTDLILGWSIRNDARRVERRVLPGIDISLAGDWAGLGIGVSDLLVAQPETEPIARDEVEGWTYAPPLGLRKRSEDGTETHVGWVAIDAREPAGETFLTSSSEIGVQARWGSVARGLSVGVGRGTTIRARPEDDGVYLVKCGGDDLLPCSFEKLEPEANR